ncbi:TonB-dependent receptor [Sphingobacterium sp. LRF_L2]|uniref:TonB-dependent receptor n=1 Tax=Sphingobacterium sp. LRF_L2 TaxID=3369421 RepID=UPI003F5EB431
MLKKNIALFLFLSFLWISGAAQITNSFLGKIVNERQEAISHVSIKLQGINYSTLSDQFGNFEIKEIPSGNYSATLSAIGYKSVSVEISITEKPPKKSQTFVLEENKKEIEQVEIVARSRAEEINRQAYNVTAIDAKKFYNTTMDIGQTLNRVSGVRIRENGGLGSNISLSLNGFSGNQVKLFIDGLPMSNFGSSFQLNNIPINFAERVEVYRGVVPIWLGGDALGGAINIVTKNEARKYLDVSYSYGSFNTHKTTVNAGFVDKSGFTFLLSAFQNYSDNNYWVNVDVHDFQTGQYEYDQRVRQFHNTYHNETLVTDIGVSNKKYADQFLVGITLGKNQKEIQTGNNMQDVYGGRETLGNIIQPSIKYLKRNLFTEGLTVSMAGRYNLGRERSLDTIPALFNWRGEMKYKNPNNPTAPGGESTLTDYRYRNNNAVFSANITYDLNSSHNFALNHQFSNFDRKGEDRFYPDSEENNQPKKTRKHITGIGYRYTFNEKWNTNVFAKHYYQKNISHDVSNGIYYHAEKQMDYMGYGIAMTYFLQSDLQLKTSFERAIRLPENNELFGDLENQSGNANLKPEKSYNFNFGASYFVKLNDQHRASLDANYIFRNASDYIRAVVEAEDANGRQISHFLNLRSALNHSFDFNFRYFYKNLISLGGNMTYQRLTNQTKVEPNKINESAIYGDQLPNIPYQYGNFDANIHFQNVLQEGSVLSLGYNLLYVHEFFLDWPSYGTPSKRNTIPEQLSHDLNIVYSLKSGKYNIAFECLNFTDVTRYDNFALQKPSRSFNLKLRYFIKNK